MEDGLLLGYTLVKEMKYTEALSRFRPVMAAYEEDPPTMVPAKLLSYFGLALALGENRINEAVTYCTTAIKKEFNHPEWYVNLARVYLKANGRSKAINVLYKGLKVDSEDPGILLELSKLGIRSRPVFRFLHRGHMINKNLGLLMSCFRSPKKNAK